MKSYVEKALKRSHDKLDEFLITSQAGLSDLENLGIRVPKNANKKTAGYVWLDKENQICAIGIITFSTDAELRQKTFPLKSNVDYGKVSRIVKFETRRK